MITNGLKRENLQIIPFNTNIMLLGREKDYGIVIDSDIINSMKEKTLNGGNANEHMISLEEGGKSLMELFMMKKDEGSTIVMSMVDGHMDGFQYCGRLTRAKTKALPNHVTKTQGIMLEKLVVRSYTMVMNGGMMVEGKSTLSSSIKKDTYAEVVARKSWKGFKIVGQITNSMQVMMEEIQRMKGKQLLLAYG